MPLSRYSGAVCLLAAFSFSTGLNAQQRVDPANLHQRLIAILPLTGSGSYSDPRRPLFAPASLDPTGKTGIIAYAWQPTDDGRSAIVQFVARDRAAFAAIESANRPDVRSFVRGLVKRSDLETELKRLKRDFALDQIEVVIP